MQRPDAMGMRHAASQFHSKAERTASVSARLDAQVGAMTYAGPAADQFRAAMNQIHNALAINSGVMRQLADALNSAAVAVEADPARFYGGAS
jgi:uncharacterized protein YukE